MKAILLLLGVLISGQVFAENISFDFKLAKAAAERECARNPEYCQALEVYKADIEQVKKLEGQLAKLEREKAFVCRPQFTDLGGPSSIDVQFEQMQSCKASVKYTEDTAKIDSRISQVSSLLDLALQDREQSKILVSYLYAKKSSVAGK